MKCTCRRHAVFEGSDKSKFAQVWPYEMCARIVGGYQTRIMHITNECPYPNRTYPEGVVFDCPACRPAVVNKHFPHIGDDEPPQLCKYVCVIWWKWTCPGCNLRLHVDRKTSMPLTKIVYVMTSVSGAAAKRTDNGGARAPTGTSLYPASG